MFAAETFDPRLMWDAAAGLPRAAARERAVKRLAAEPAFLGFFEASQRGAP